MRYILIIFMFFIPRLVFGNIVIFEVMCNPIGSDADNEWVKIKNISTTSIDITGWKFNDGTNHNLNIPPKNGGIGDMNIEPGEVALLANKADKVSGEDTIIDTVMSLSNSGDTLKILDDMGNEVHSITYKADDVTEGELCFIYNNTQTNIDTDAGTSTTSQTAITTYKEVQKWKTVEIEPPQDIYIREIAGFSALAGSRVYIDTEVYNSRGSSVTPKCYITFGDGNSAESCNAEHVYEFAGSYIITIRARKNGLQDIITVPIRIEKPDMSLRVDEQYAYVEIINNMQTNAELNGWVVKVDYKKFKIPNNTVIPAKQSIKISANTLGIDIARYGGVARLFDALGNNISNSDTFVLKEDIKKSNITEPVIVEIQEKPKKDLPLVETILQNNEVENILTANNISDTYTQDVEITTAKTETRSTTTAKRKPKAHSGIIGMKVLYQKQPNVKSAQEEVVSKEPGLLTENTQREIVQYQNQIQNSASASNAFYTEYFLNLYDNASKVFNAWMVGLVALIGLAIVPVIMGRSYDMRDAHESDKSTYTDEHDIENQGGDKHDDFNIEEIK